MNVCPVLDLHTALTSTKIDRQLLNDFSSWDFWLQGGKEGIGRTYITDLLVVRNTCEMRSMAAAAELCPFSCRERVMSECFWPAIGGSSLHPPVEWTVLLLQCTHTLTQAPKKNHGTRLRCCSSHRWLTCGFFFFFSSSSSSWKWDLLNPTLNLWSSSSGNLHVTPVQNDVHCSTDFPKLFPMSCYKKHLDCFEFVVASCFEVCKWSDISFKRNMFELCFSFTRLEFLGLALRCCTVILNFLNCSLICGGF